MTLAIACCFLAQVPLDVPVPLVATVTTYVPKPDLFAACLQDAAKLGANAQYVRYLDATNRFHVKHFYGVMCGAVNLVSTGGFPVKPRKVMDWLYAVDIRDYKWKTSTWENLAKADPYYHLHGFTGNFTYDPVTKTVITPATAPAEVAPVTVNQFGQPIQKSTQGIVANNPPATPAKVEPKPEGKKEFKLTTIPAPYFAKSYWEGKQVSQEDFAALAALHLMTQSDAPIIRADFFLNQVGFQQSRIHKTGYFDFLGLTSRDDFENLIGLNRKGSIKRFREIAEIFDVSQVARQNRGLAVYQAETGNVYVTFDSLTSVGKQDAAINYFEDFKHDGEEIIGFLPNRFPVYYICNDKGVQVNEVPIKLAGDKTATNNDREVQVKSSCIRCHGEVLKTLDHGTERNRFKKGGGVIKDIPLDSDGQQRHRAAFESDLKFFFDRDQELFNKIYLEWTGMSALEFSKAYSYEISQYLDAPVTLEMAAVEVGHPPEFILKRLRDFAPNQHFKVLDRQLVNYAAPEKHAIRRDKFEAVYPVLMLSLPPITP